MFLENYKKFYVSLKKRKDQGPGEREGKIAYHIIYVLHHFICELRNIVQMYSVHTTQIFIITHFDMNSIFFLPILRYETEQNGNVKIIPGILARNNID